MSKYPKPKLFKPTLEEQIKAAEEVLKHLSPKVGVRLSDGTIVQGERGKLKILKK